MAPRPASPRTSRHPRQSIPVRSLAHRLSRSRLSSGRSLADGRAECPTSCLPKIRSHPERKRRDGVISPIFPLADCDAMARPARLRLVMAIVLLAGEAWPRYRWSPPCGYLPARSFSTTAFPSRTMALRSRTAGSVNHLAGSNRLRRNGQFDLVSGRRLTQAQPEQPASPVDYSGRPHPKGRFKAEPAKHFDHGARSAMADWLGYGCEMAYADAREIGILRQARTIQPDPRPSPQRSGISRLAQAAREMIAANGSW